MKKTAFSDRTYVSIFGNTNTGKSALFNALLGQDMAVVSEKSGTTTDPVIKSMELIGYGPIILTDTAGMGDTSDIGGKRMEKTRKIMDRTDFAIYAEDSANVDEDAYVRIKSELDKRSIKSIRVFTKADLSEKSTCSCGTSVYTSVYDGKSIEKLLRILAERLKENAAEEETMIGGLLPEGATAVLVIPIDSEAPHGRLILPQVRLIRDCLDHGIKAVCVRETELDGIFDEIKNIDAVITDSQIFKRVAELVPERIKLTSFSILLAAVKGDIKVFSEGAAAVERLRDGSRILMAEACTHSSSHEDIGRVKIPQLLKKYTGKDLIFEYGIGYDFPNEPEKYDMVIHCGGCMINSQSMKRRLERCVSAGVPITNYGTVIAYINGILERSTAIFRTDR